MNLKQGVDILENELVARFPEVLEILLKDRTTGNNILWATDNYEEIGEGYGEKEQIQSRLITGKFGNVIMPRVEKNKNLQVSRVKEKAEVFTPSWVCNAQNNLIDDEWFNQKNVFNTEISSKNKSQLRWKTSTRKIKFPKNKSWIQYVLDKRLEIACGEAPYITSRYDTTTGVFIPIKERIGVLDRKLRVINENVNESGKWLKATQDAFKSTYAYEWQGDNLLLAREAMLCTFIENYSYKFKRIPQLKSIRLIADIVSWNVWQMDGLKGVVPYSCRKTVSTIGKVFEENEIKENECIGCQTNNFAKHNGIYCLIKNWSENKKTKNKSGKIYRFIDLLTK